MTLKNNQAYHDVDQKYYLQTFRRYPIVLEKGEGATVWDVEGNRYVDALAGIAVNNVGHNHPNVVNAIREQAGKLIHISNFYLSRPQVELSQKLVEMSGLDRVFFSNSGAESVEGAIKLARKYAHSKGYGGTVISMSGSFHGRTLATIATGKKAMQEGFEPIPQGFAQATFNNIESVKKLVDNETAAIIVEPIQGEGGINVADKQFLTDLRTLCDERDLVLIFDEIQCGMGRTGRWFAKDYYGVQPDIITLAKGLGGGVPVGAILSNDKVSQAINFGDHGTTFGGNPLACAAALATIQTIDEENLLKASVEKGKWLHDKLSGLNEPAIKLIKGKGLMMGVEFDFETKPLVAEMLKNGVLANATAGNILRLVPPLNITYPELEEVLRVLKISLQNLREHG